MKKKYYYIIGAALIVAILIIFIVTKNKKPSVVYREVTVTKENLNITVLSTGTVQPENRLEIKPPIAGRVEQVVTDEGRYVKRGDILAWMSSTERAALIDSARAKGPEEVKRWEEYYKPTPILAPINGTIILKNVESGQTFTSSDAVFVMSDRLTVKAQVDETDIAQIKLGLSADIVLDAYPDQIIKAKVDRIAYDAKIVNNVTTYIVDVLPLKSPKFMISGMTANVTFYITSKNDVLTVPSNAIKIMKNKSWVTVKDANQENAKTEREVKTGLSDGKKIEITSGVQEGETIYIAEKRRNSSDSDKKTNPFSPFGQGQGGQRRAN